MKKIIHNFFISHSLSIIFFSIIYYLLMLNIDKHFVMGSTFSNKLLHDKILNCITIAASIESTNGITDISPASFICKLTIFLQYVMTIIITGYFVS
jgi:hypothetical protein